MSLLKLSVVPEKRLAGVVECVVVALDVIVDTARAGPSVKHQPIVQRLAGCASNEILLSDVVTDRKSDL